MKIKLVAKIILVFISFLCLNCSFYYVLVFWTIIIFVLLFLKRRPIILVLSLFFVTNYTAHD